MLGRFTRSVATAARPPSDAGRFGAVAMAQPRCAKGYCELFVVVRSKAAFRPISRPLPCSPVSGSPPFLRRPFRRPLRRPLLVSSASSSCRTTTTNTVQYALHLLRSVLVVLFVAVLCVAFFLSSSSSSSAYRYRTQRSDRTQRRQVGHKIRLLCTSWLVRLLPRMLPRVRCPPPPLRRPLRGPLRRLPTTWPFMTSSTADRGRSER